MYDQSGKIEYLEHRLTLSYEQNREASKEIQNLKKQLIQKETTINYYDVKVRGLLKSLEVISEETMKHIPEYLSHLTNQKGD